MVDWVGILREVRLLLTRLQTDRFYAFLLLISAVALIYLIRKY